MSNLLLGMSKMTKAKIDEICLNCVHFHDHYVNTFDEIGGDFLIDGFCMKKALTTNNYSDLVCVLNCDGCPDFKARPMFYCTDCDEWVEESERGFHNHNSILHTIKAFFNEKKKDAPHGK